MNSFHKSGYPPLSFQTSNEQLHLVIKKGVPPKRTPFSVLILQTLQSFPYP
ncbi:hypothetical protein HMPREF0083_04481 [Aneurinibacillus aneurinilyticus ATCC 12856]|uniref:Uncharacterized protein n=1 Tax=Aneurinibacillus aneurinilyticus ATCC 12856 TaxID=649747 RepID=U1WFV8_ANEAE|nr:hypothetical protein HMPREF0083_04481 [Aneurinibacillus aneurinilyticus ATCC 12856]